MGIWSIRHWLLVDTACFIDRRPMSHTLKGLPGGKFLVKIFQEYIKALRRKKSLANHSLSGIVTVLRTLAGFPAATL